MNPSSMPPVRAESSLRVGVLTPHLAVGPEVELVDMAPGRVHVTLARVRRGAGVDEPPAGAAGLLSLTHGPALDRAVEEIREATVDVVLHASTTTSYALGPDGERRLVDRLRGDLAVPVVVSGAASVAALSSLGARRVAVVHPPWISDDLGELGLGYFRAHGFEVSLSRAEGVPSDSSLVRREQVVGAVAGRFDDRADAVFLGGNGFRTASAVQELERRVGRPVLAANQVLLWSALAATGRTWDVAGYGALFGTSPIEAPFAEDS